MRQMREFKWSISASVVLIAVCASAYAEPLSSPIIRDCIMLHENHSAQYKNGDAYDLLKIGNYVYCATSEGLEVVDVSDPDNLTITHSWDGDNNKMNGVDYLGNYLYIANWSPWCGLRVLDFSSNPAAPSLIRTKSTLGHTFPVTVHQGQLYVTLAGSGYYRINTYDLSTPSDPSLEDYIDPSGGNITASSNVAGLGDYIYFGAGRWLYVYNVSNPSNPTYQTRRDIDAYCQRVHVYQNHLYVTATDSDYLQAYSGGLHVFSLSNPASPSNVVPGGGPYLDSSGGGSDLHTQGHYLLAVMGSRSVTTFDVSNPAAPTIIHNNWVVRWDDDGDGDPNDPGCHDGYTNVVTGAGNFVYVGTTHDGAMTGDEYCFGARLYCVQIAEGEVEEELDEVHVDLGSPDIENGITHPEGGDGDTIPATKGGRVCRVNEDPNDDKYFMFKVSDSFCYAGSKPELYIAIDYFDQGTNTLTLQYDSPGDLLADKYKDGGSVTLTNTNTWKQHVFHITDAYFANRQNFDADFRIFGGGAGNTFYLDIVHVAEALPTPVIETSLTTIDRSVPSGMNPGNDAFLLTNTGGGTMYYTITDDADWLTVDPSTGTSSGESDMISLNYDITGLSTGDYIATVTVADPNASNSPQTVTVQLYVLVVGKLDADDDVDQQDFGILQNCFSGPGVLLAPGCEQADLDGDLDVDLNDFSMFQDCMGGANNPPGC